MEENTCFYDRNNPIESEKTNDVREGNLAKFLSDRVQNLEHKYREWL